MFQLIQKIFHLVFFANFETKFVVFAHLFVSFLYKWETNCPAKVTACLNTRKLST